MAELLDPIIIKGLVLKNRIVMPPMQTSLASPEGAVTDDLIRHYIRRSKDIGLIVVEHSYISIEGKLDEKQLGVYEDKLIPGLEMLVSKVHALGTPLVLQINHAGMKISTEIAGVKPVGPSSDESTRELKVEEIESLPETYASAAERAMKAGFDGVEVHGAHGFLLNQFYSPLTNRRSDNYGGTFENRIRLSLEVVERVKEKVDGRLLLYRLGSEDLDPRGIQIEDSRKFAKKLEEAGVDLIDVSGGMCGSRPEQLQDTQGYFIPQAQEIKEMVDIPVIGVGGIRDPEYANNLIKEGRVDLVAVGRKLLEDPNWITKTIKILQG